MKKVRHFKPKWYKPFELIKRNSELERVVEELLSIIDDYSDDLVEKKNQLDNLEKIINSMQEDKDSIVSKITINRNGLKYLK